MNQKSELRRLAYLILFIFVVNLIALKLYWYSLIWYFDMPMHFLGGAWLSFTTIWLFKISNFDKKTIWTVFFWVILVGAGWEMFEFVVDHRVGTGGFNIIDTLSDICFDLAGGFVALLYHFRKSASIVII